MGVGNRGLERGEYTGAEGLGGIQSCGAGRPNADRDSPLVYAFMLLRLLGFVGSFAGQKGSVSFLTAIGIGLCNKLLLSLEKEEEEEERASEGAAEEESEVGSLFVNAGGAAAMKHGGEGGELLNIDLGLLGLLG